MSPLRLTAVADTHEISRLDGRPVQSIDDQPGQTSFSITKPAPAWMMLEVRGFQEFELVSRYLTVV
jgi:hypothetical protein